MEAGVHSFSFYSQFYLVHVKDAWTPTIASCEWFLLALALSHPVIESCKAAQQLKLTWYKGAAYGPKTGTNI